MSNLIADILLNTPLNPHWLHSMKYRQANRVIFRRAFTNKKGKLLEVGAGDGMNKLRILAAYPDLKYTATDYSSWDGEFENINKLAKSFGSLAEAVLGFHKRIELDDVCDAMKLPYANASYDYHLSLETLEHLNRPLDYFSEAARVLKKGGAAVLSTPYMFRMHGGEPNHEMDFYRYSAGFYLDVADTYGFKVESIYSNTGIGTTMATMVNQWLLLLFGNKIAIKLLASIIFCPIFVVTNVLGIILDIFPDRRFATHFHVILRKK